jgi:hypothetical protein
MIPSIFIFGFGYTAAFLAKKLAALGFNIAGTSRNPALCEYYKSEGYQIVDFTDSALTGLLSHATHLLITIPPSPNFGDSVLGNFRSLLEQFCHQLQWIGYVSSTGVYGDHPYSIYNIADDEPAPSHEVDQYAARLLNISPPKLIPFETAVLSSMAQEFYSNNRRVSNEKIKHEFNIQLEFPSYREGLRQLYESGCY